MEPMKKTDIREIDEPVGIMFLT